MTVLGGGGTGGAKEAIFEGRLRKEESYLWLQGKGGVSAKKDRLSTVPRPGGRKDCLSLVRKGRGEGAQGGKNTVVYPTTKGREGGDLKRGKGG